MADKKDIMLGANDDLIIGKDFKIDDSEAQEVGIILRLNQGDLKSDPLLGPNLIKVIKSNASTEDVERLIKLHLKRDKKRFEDYKNQINIKR